MLEIQTEIFVRPYESVVIVHPDVTEEEQKALFKKNKGIIESFKGELFNLDTWGKRRLSNPIKKLPRGTYFHAIFTATPDAIAELERTMRINDKVLRFLHTRLEDGTDPNKFLENYKNTIQQTLEREREREAKFQAKRAARSREGGFREGGPRVGGFRDGGSREGGSREGGFRDGGSREGGPRDGGFRRNSDGDDN